MVTLVAGFRFCGVTLASLWRHFGGQRAKRRGVELPPKVVWRFVEDFYGSPMNSTTLGGYIEKSSTILHTTEKGKMLTPLCVIDRADGDCFFAR